MRNRAAGNLLLRVVPWHFPAIPARIGDWRTVAPAILSPIDSGDAWRTLYTHWCGKLKGGAFDAIRSCGSCRNRALILIFWFVLPIHVG